MPGSTERRWTVRGPSRSLVLLLLVDLLVLVAWSLVIPINEAPDETAHWEYGNFLYRNWDFPVFPQSYEFHQPPLYYLLIAPLSTDSHLPSPLWWTDDQGQLHVPDTPRFFAGHNSDLMNYWPFRLARLATVLLSLAAVAFCYWAGVEATQKESVGLLCAALIAFLPGFTFRGSTLSNDAPVVLWSAIFLYLTIRLIRRGFSWRIGFIAAFTSGLAILTKTNTLFFPVILAGVILADRIPWHARIRHLTVLVVTCVMIAPWFFRNQLLYGDPLVVRAMIDAWKDTPQFGPKSILSPYFYNTFPQTTFNSFVGVFGWMNLWMPIWMYELFAILAAIAGVGCVKSIHGRGTNPRIVLVLIGMLLASIALMISYNLTFNQAQGRYIYTALPAVVILGAIGLESLLARSHLVQTVLISGLGALNVLVLSVFVFPAYWPAPDSYRITPVVNVPPKIPAAELVQGVQISQSFISKCDRLDQVELFMGDPGQADSPLLFDLIDRESEKVIVQKEIPTRDIRDQAWNVFTFAELDSIGREYVIELQSPSGSVGHAMTVYRSQLDRYEDGSAFINGEPIPSDLAFRYSCSY